MTDLATIEPISASADGKRNMYCVQCTPTGQTMNYAACLWRQSVLSSPNVKTPADWAACDKARQCNSCPALQMRQEEEVAGKAIYFEDRTVFRKITDAAKRWITPVLPSGITKRESTLRRDPAVAARHSGSMLDSMGDMGSLADAVTAAAVTPAAPIVTAVAHAGESPLQMARRIAAERSTSL